MHEDSDHFRYAGPIQSARDSKRKTHPTLNSGLTKGESMGESMNESEAASFSAWVEDVIGGYSEGVKFHSYNLNRLVAMTGCEEVPIPGSPGRTKMACRICGPDFNPGKCSREKHAAYYESFT